MTFVYAKGSQVWKHKEDGTFVLVIGIEHYSDDDHNPGSYLITLLEQDTQIRHQIWETDLNNDWELCEIKSIVVQVDVVGHSGIAEFEFGPVSLEEVQQNSGTL